MIKVTSEPSPKKSKKGVQKRVVSVPIGDVEGSRSKGEAYPPSDSWAWRKYGQKPIKGSPYPRGYYRCSSSKGCPARKQVERSRVDPTKLIITYACEHNHPLPTKSHTSTSIVAPTTDETPANIPTDEVAVFSSQPDIDLSDESTLLFSDYQYHHKWFDDVATTVVFESSIFSGGGVDIDADVPMASSAGSVEDESLFADLEELPECSVVFRRRIAEPDEPNRRCSLNVIPCYSSTE
ncbi:hypothetical protein UlMin_023396 [Ulmus minor]